MSRNVLWIESEMTKVTKPGLEEKDRVQQKKKRREKRKTKMNVVRTGPDSAVEGMTR